MLGVRKAVVVKSAQKLGSKFYYQKNVNRLTFFLLAGMLLLVL